MRHCSSLSPTSSSRSSRGTSGTTSATLLTPLDPLYMPGHAAWLAPSWPLPGQGQFQSMEDLGIIRRSDSPWASPLHVVPKSDGSWRPCGDYRQLNAVTKDDQYPLPHTQDFNGNLVGRSVFSVVDLVRGFHQIPMAPQDIPKTAIITPFGLFEFVRMPFGLKNAAQAFQRLMDGILRGIDFAFVYLDDTLVASRSQEEHLTHLRALFHLLSAHGIITVSYTHLTLPTIYSV